MRQTPPTEPPPCGTREVPDLPEIRGIQVREVSDHLSTDRISRARPAQALSSASLPLPLEACQKDNLKFPVLEVLLPFFAAIRHRNPCPRCQHILNYLRHTNP